MQYLADEQTECQYRNSYSDGTEDVQQEVGVIQVQPFSYEWKGGYKQEMQQVNIQRSHSGILHDLAKGTFLTEPTLAMAEEHHHHQQQRVHGCGAG